MFNALACHAIMGAALGVVLALALTLIPGVHVASLIDHGVERSTTMLVVVCALMATFGVDATLTGFVLLMVDDAASNPNRAGGYASWRRAQDRHER
jgi:hypothetical protein